MCTQVKVIQIDDFQLITSKEEPKNFEITFESLGTGTCMEVDFKDGAIKAYGDKSFCEEWLPDIRFRTWSGGGCRTRTGGAGDRGGRGSGCSWELRAQSNRPSPTPSPTPAHRGQLARRRHVALFKS